MSLVKESSIIIGIASTSTAFLNMSSFFFSLMTMVAVFFFLDDLAHVKIFWMSILSSENLKEIVESKDLVFTKLARL